MDELEEPRPPSISKLSKTPSWIMLGFVLGALFVWSLERDPEKAPAAPVMEPEKPEPVAPLRPPRQSDIEAVFAMWGGGAIWENDVTEIALWTPETKRYSDFFEVIRAGDNLYFRSIPRLTRRVLDHGVKANSPLQLTETEAHHQEWLRDVKDVNWGAFTNPNAVSPPNATTPPPEAARPGRVRADSSEPYHFVVPPPEPAPVSVPPRTGTGDGKP